MMGKKGDSHEYQARHQAVNMHNSWQCQRLFVFARHELLDEIAHYRSLYGRCYQKIIGQDISGKHGKGDSSHGKVPASIYFRDRLPQAL